MLKTKTFLFVSLLAGLALAGCTRSASGTSDTKATQDPIESIFSTVATQTALAAKGNTEKSGDDGELAPTNTPTPTPVLSPTPSPTITQTPAPTTESVVPSTYTLHRGEWPYCLARRFNIDPDTLLAANNISNSAELSVGTVINIPAAAGTFGDARSLRAHPTTYTSSSTDTFFSIACQFGDVWPEHIAETNGQKLDYEPSAGEQIHIP
ncbi:MAG: LysM domain-containing protein [Chloroflexi bacterium]|nr:LysM domain-containing protein [Chloroflexota bacterium]MQC27180.1 LysM domain-containing protein [Chloroflexota bacterium]